MDQYTDDAGLNDELKTCKKYIDHALEQRGWLRKYVKEQVNHVKSDFKRKKYTYNNGKTEDIDEFIDYILLDEDYTVLAIIEAKKFSVNENEWQIQAKTYIKNIEEQLNYKISFFLTNGRIWHYSDEDGIERNVSGPFSQDDLRRRKELHKKKRNPKDVKIDSRIVDRPRSVQIVRKLSEHFADGNKKALVQMATGTGKTRVAMAIINLLINSNTVRNVLFIADRVALVNQAKSDGFKKFFKEPVADLRDDFTTTGRHYVSTIQTLMQGNQEKFFERFSPGFFDLIVFDEAHRSIYDRNNLLNKYFDAIKIGLTATPSEIELRNTYELFDCPDGEPTVEYSYDEAVRDGVLVPYRAEIIGTKVLSTGISGGKLTPDLKEQLIRQEYDPELIKFTGSQFDRVFMDNKTNELIIREFVNHCYKSDEGLPSKSIFFCASQRHAHCVKKLFGNLYPNIDNEVQVITSNMPGAEYKVKSFKTNSLPRIALSVGMLDTGVDIPEICNLIFIKPVFSHIRFWQMVGRGTRNEKACTNKQWLPNGDKKDFLIFDFKTDEHSNIEFHEFNTAEDKAWPKDVITKIFDQRVQILKKQLTISQKEIITKKIMDTLESLDENSFIVREKIDLINELKNEPSALDEHIKELSTDISPLMIINQGTHPNISSFIYITEKLFGFILVRKINAINKTKEFIQDRLENILQKDNLNEVKENRMNIITVLDDEFWVNLTFNDVEFIIKKIAPLMKYYEPNRKKIINIDAPDLVISRNKFKKEIEEDKELKEFLNKNPITRKIKNGECITSHELMELERSLSALRPEISINNIQKYHKKDFLLFIREIIGLSREKDPKELIEERFNKYIISDNPYNSRQLEFLMLLKKVFAERKHIEIEDFATSPLADEHPLDYFTLDELKTLVDKCNQIKMC